MKQTTAMDVLEALEKTEPIHMIDVRETEEVKEGKIPGAVNIPLGLLEFRLHELDKSKEYTVICRSGGRSAKGAQLLESHGYQVVNMVDGMMAWTGPTE